MSRMDKLGLGLLIAAAAFVLYVRIFKPEDLAYFLGPW